jgi:hypothetical protein
MIVEGGKLKATELTLRTLAKGLYDGCILTFKLHSGEIVSGDFYELEPTCVRIMTNKGIRRIGKRYIERITFYEPVGSSS